MRYVITVAISMDADSEDEVEHGLQGALDNLTGDDIRSCEILEVRPAPVE